MALVMKALLTSITAKKPSLPERRSGLPAVMASKPPRQVAGHKTSIIPERARISPPAGEQGSYLWDDFPA
jgi:hypothetical protein